MNKLSEPTVSEIARALAKEYQDARELVAWWDARLKQPKPPPNAEACLDYAKETVERCGSALKEVAQELAPWVRHLRECKPVFEQESDTPTKENNT